MTRPAATCALVALLIVCASAITPKRYTFWRDGVPTAGDMSLVATVISPEGLTAPKLEDVQALAKHLFNDPFLTVLYTLDGDTVDSDSKVQAADNLVPYRAGGAFTWQPQEVGQTRTIALDDRQVEITTLSKSPKVFLLKGLANVLECERIQAHARLSGIKQDQIKSVTNILFTNGMPYDFWNDEFVALHKRVANVTRSVGRVLDPEVTIYNAASPNRASGFSLQYDYLQNFPQSKRNFLGTVQLFLTNLPEGGAVVFPGSTPGFAPGLKEALLIRTTCDGKTGGVLRIQPKQGDAILYYNLHDTDHAAPELDNTTLKAHCDHVGGEGKYVVKFPITNIGPISVVEPSRRVWVFADYTPTAEAGPHYLTIKKEDQIFLTDDRRTDWWEGVLNGKRGFFPANYVQRMNPVPKRSQQTKPAQQAAATNSNTAPSGNKDEL